MTPTRESLLAELQAAAQEFPGGWSYFSPHVDDMLRDLWQREPGLLRRRVTKLDGEGWGLVSDQHPGRKRRRLR